MSYFEIILKLYIPCILIKFSIYKPTKGTRGVHMTTTFRYTYVFQQIVLPSSEFHALSLKPATLYRGAVKSLARLGRKQTTATEDFDIHISYLNHNRKNISNVYIYNKTSIKRNILTIKQNTS